jgi:hypothetical protein
VASVAPRRAAEHDVGDVPGYRWLSPAAGVLTIVIGIVRHTYPGPTLLALGVLFDDGYDND